MVYWRKKIKICIFLSISGFVLIWRFQNRQFRPILVVFLVPLWHQNDHQYWSKLEDSLGGCWGCMWKSNFLNQKVLAISKVKNSPFTFSKPAPEASPVLTLGISSKGQVRTNTDPAGTAEMSRLLHCKVKVQHPELLALVSAVIMSEIPRMGTQWVFLAIIPVC